MVFVSKEARRAYIMKAQGNALGLNIHTYQALKERNKKGKKTVKRPSNS